MKKFIKSNQIIVINIAFLIGGLFLGWFGYDYYWEYKFLSLEEGESTSIEADYSLIEEESKSSILKVIEPYHCDASSNLSDDHSCKNLTNNDYTGWKDAGNSCLDESLTFYFDKTYFIEFIVISNFEKASEFKEVDKINGFTITYPNTESEETETRHFLELDNYEQWFDINKLVTDMKFEIFSNYDSPVTDTCGLQEIRFYGKEPVQTTNGNS
tara:strand:- start:1933 stop:2571 length:639 start_codon:yes stop_codon:yes gene_type:complete